eukprot:Plantae.Rhodophyta-Purpureofilum_apyrenoidigerum.ctg56113.p1 GENE.Plantae.Rhodophyta-Purpureofilum_apyrenoidigerum.ctg56113~~Plantae.Rhodophyta-Purpureofilum_apyrenoidigerum.ctg56113.p1  ORF type:complete len:250 (-),score=36.31 Plantae.Rhodophyta-Purpureofilum_apyrenoidigerum.ctg56113:80-829(-)
MASLETQSNANTARSGVTSQFSHKWYYDVDDLLMTEERFVCTFNVIGRSLGHLEQSVGDDKDVLTELVSESEKEDEENDTLNDTEGSSEKIGLRDLPKGTKVEVPCWLAETLARRNYVSIHLPRFYSSTVRNDLRAGPNSVNLSDKCHFFFELGFRLSSLLVDDELQTVLRTAYAERCWRVADNAGWEGKTKGIMVAMRKLDNLERGLFLSVTDAINAYESWKERCAERIGSPKSKRKRSREALLFSSR